jgi:hypothetical protein
MGFPANLLPHFKRRSGGGLFIRQWIVDKQPEPPQALQASHVARLRKVLPGH